MVKKCHTYGIKNIFVAGLVYTTGIGLPILERTHEMNDHLCNKLGKCFLTAYIKRGIYLGDGIWVKVFKNGLSKICGRQPLQNLKWYDNTKRDISVSKSSAADLEMLQNNGLKFLDNSLIAYLKINSLRYKIFHLREILKDLSLDYWVIIETKLNESFPNAQVKLNGYEARKIRDRHKYGDGLIEFAGQGFICKKLKECEPFLKAF